MNMMHVLVAVVTYCTCVMSALWISKRESHMHSRDEGKS